MKIKFIFLLLVIIVIIVFAGFCSKKTSSFDYYVGRLTRATFRFPSGYFKKYIANPQGENTENILSELINKKNYEWKRFSYKEKKEFTLIAIILNDIEGGSLQMLLILLGNDSVKIGKELSSIPNSVLKEKFNLNKEGITHFKSIVNFIQGENNSNILKFFRSKKGLEQNLK